MKATLTEYDGTFAIDLQAETLQEATMMVKAGMNCLKARVRPETYLTENGSVFMGVFFKKCSDASSNVPHRT